MAMTTPRHTALPQDRGVAVRSSSHITLSTLENILLGICTATGIPKRSLDRFQHRLSILSAHYDSLNQVVEEHVQISSGAESWFSAWFDVFAPSLSERDADLRELLNIGFVVLFLRESRQKSIAINGEDLTVLWNFVHNALVGSQFSSPLSAVSYNAQGFFIIPLCNLTTNNSGIDGDEQYSLHIWLPNSSRDSDFCVHLCQTPFQGWILAGDGKYSTFKVESVTDLEHATHAEFESKIQILEGIGKQYNEDQSCPILKNTGRLVRATKIHSSVHTFGMSYRIEPGIWYTLDVVANSLHAGIFLYNPRSASAGEATILGPRNVDHQVLDSHHMDITPALLASNIDAIRSWERLFDDSKWHARRSEMEDALRVCNSALSLCETIVGFPNASYYTRLAHGELGFINRCLGRYDLAKEHLQEALKDPSLNHARIKASGELGTVYRIKNQLLEARTTFQSQYEIAKTLGDSRAACRAIGNVGMTNYQLSQRHQDEALLELAIEQLKERVSRARHIKEVLYTAKMDQRKKYGRMKHASVWETIGLNRLSLCYAAQGNTREAINAAKESYNIKIEPVDLTVIAMSHFFYGRALLQDGQREAAMGHLNPPIPCTPAIALCKESSEENRQYLQELVNVGIDMDHADEYGYTSLDYAVFGSDVEMEKIVVEGLRHTIKENFDAEIAKRQYMAKLRKGYRELFHDKMRPILLKGGADTLKNLRSVYAAALSTTQQEFMIRRFDTLKYVRYSDFLRCGRLPRYSDGFAKELSSKVHAPQELVAEFVIFFSYTWIKKEENQSFPDDADNSQYHRMVKAIRNFLNLHPAVNPDRLGIWLVRSQLPQTNHYIRDWTYSIAGLCLH